MANNKPILTEQNKIFCEEYILEFKKADSYSKAYPEASKSTCYSNGSTLLKQAKIKEYIAKLQKDIGQTSGISIFKVLKEYKKIAFKVEEDVKDPEVQVRDKIKALDSIRSVLGFNNVDITSGGDKLPQAVVYIPDNART